MRRLFTITTILFLAVTLNAKVKPIEERPQDVITYSYNLRSNHSVSTTIFGLEYSYGTTMLSSAFNPVKSSGYSAQNQ